MDQHKAYITTPDDSAAIVREAIPPPAQPQIVIPGPTDHQSGKRPGGKTSMRNRSSFYGLLLAWRGLHVLGAAFGIAGAWYVTAWIRHGRLPLTVQRTYFGELPPIRAPEWLLAVTGFLLLISLCMLLLGTQESTPKMNFKKDGHPNIWWKRLVNWRCHLHRYGDVFLAHMHEGDQSMIEYRRVFLCAIIANVLIVWPVVALLCVTMTLKGRQPFDGLQYLLLTPVSWLIGLLTATVGLFCLPGYQQGSASREERKERSLAITLCVAPFLLAVLFFYVFAIFVS